MAIELPKLDDITFHELTDWLIAMIPQYSSRWTNFNASDPGITLLELLAWVTETLLYRMDRIPIETYIGFMTLIAGASGDQIGDRIEQLKTDRSDPVYLDFLKAIKKTQDDPPSTYEPLQELVVNFLNAPYQTVTQSDIKVLARQTNQRLKPDAWKVARSYVETQRDAVVIRVLSAPCPFSRKYIRDVHQDPDQSALEVTRYIYSPRPPYADDEEKDKLAALLDEVTKYIAPRRMLGSVVLVKPCLWTPVNLKLQIRAQTDAPLEELLDRISSLLTSYLSLDQGGPRQHPQRPQHSLMMSLQAGAEAAIGLTEHPGKGWPYNYTPQATDILSLLQNLDEVAEVERLEIDFAPTMQLQHTSTLGTDALLNTRPGNCELLRFRGLPWLRIAELSVHKRPPQPGTSSSQGASSPTAN